MKICKVCKEEFSPKIDGQTMCLDCIMREAPKESEAVSLRTTDGSFVNWFIYTWRNIRRSAERDFGVDFDTASEELNKR